MLLRVMVGIALAACALAPARAARAPKPLPAQTVVLKAVDRLEAAGSLDSATAAADRAALARTVALVGRVPKPRAELLKAQLDQAARVAPKLTAPRAAAIFGQLEVNDDWLAAKGLPRSEPDVTGPDGIVYRFFSHRGFEFHPLANFAALNAAVAAKDGEATRRLADALSVRGVATPRGGLAWEYYFDFGRGKAPWLSGMAQAVAAQAFARASVLLDDDTSLLDEARAAYRTIPGRLDRVTSAGLWIKLYSFGKDVVLNAQLQTILSLQTYAGLAEDDGAAGLAAELEHAAAGSLGRFDTGYWSYYSLPDTPSPLGYHDYVIDLLKRLSSADPRFAAAATRFAAYETQPPAFKLADGGVGAVRFWISKPSVVTVAALDSVRRLSLDGGWQLVTWKLPKRAGIWPVTLSATDSSGNHARVEALPIVHVVTPEPVAKPRARQKPPARQKAAADADEGPTATGPAFLVGAGVDDAAQGSLAQRNGFNTVRLTVPWPLGATAPDAATLASLRGAPPGERLVLELVADPPPADDADREALASYAASLARRVPGVDDLLLGPPPAPTTASAYAAAFTAVEAAVELAAPSLAVGLELDGTEAPRATLARLASAGTSAPDVLAFRPAPAAKTGAWTVESHAFLESALASAFPGATVPVLEDQIGRQAVVPAEKAHLYSSPLPTGAGTEAEQAASYSSELAAAGCRPNVIGVLLQRLADGPAAGEQDGLFYPDATPKASLDAVRSAAADAAKAPPGTCPGLSAVAAASTLVFPETLSAGVPPGVRVGCARDCLYLLTLERTSDGKPVLARRGSLRGGAAPATIRLPKVAFPPGSYRLTARVVSQANPGPIAVASSPVLVASGA